jgi:hypothetical protein
MVELSEWSWRWSLSTRNGWGELVGAPASRVAAYQEDATP